VLTIDLKKKMDKASVMSPIDFLNNGWSWKTEIIK